MAIRAATCGPLRVLALLTLLYATGCAADDEPSPTFTTAPVFLPLWNQQSWSLVRGSVLDMDTAASETTYTIFCPEQTPPACGLSLEFPFELVEGPDTVDFRGVYTSTYIADLGCDLNGTTAARCSGYSSYRSGYSNGWVTGPTEISWTSTYTGSDVEWGVLTMAEKPKHTDDSLDIGATATTAQMPDDPDNAPFPVETGAAGALSSREAWQWALLAGLASGLCASLL